MATRPIPASGRAAAPIRSAAPQRQPLAGFEPAYADIVDYTIRSARRVWDERAVGLIYTHYKHDCVVTTPLGVTRSRDEVIADTLRMLAAYPDRRVKDGDVIWSGDDQRGFYTSHRVTAVARNTGWSEFGPPTGKTVTWRSIADCVVHQNRVCEQWLVRDAMAAILQMGFDPRAVARKIAADKAARGEAVADYGDIDRLPGQLPPPDKFSAPAVSDPAEALVCQTLHDIWNRRRFDAIRTAYARNVVAHAPQRLDLKGQNAYASYVIALLAMLSNAGMLIHHVCSAPDGSGGRKVAVRWTLDGHHDGPGRLGDPTGARLSLLGISHFHVRGGRIAEEWLHFDELSLLVQLELQAPQPVQENP
jgi:predicted ester cyclase